MKKTRKFSVRPVGRPNSDINVTPLVDVVLVLLIIFMVVTPLLEKMLYVRVPDAEQQDQQDQPPSTQVVVSVAENGDLAINNEKVADDAYIEKLKRFMAARDETGRLVFFTSDDKAKYPRLVFALDGARQAGVTIMTMTTESMTTSAAAAAAAAAAGAPAGPATP